MGRSLFNPNDNLTGRDGGPYLDEVEARSAESRRAVVEGREPDFDNPAPPAGIPLINAGRASYGLGVNNLPSQSHRYDLDAGGLVDSAAADDNNGLVVRDEIPDDFEEVSEEVTESDSDEPFPTNSHDPAEVSADPSEDDTDVDNDEPATAAELNFDSMYEDDASRKE